MGTPTQKQSSRTKRKRASHFALPNRAANVCASCGAACLTHRACPACGSYRGRTVVDTRKRAERRLRKKT